MNLPRIYKLNKYLVSSAPFLFFAFMPFLAVAEENGSPYGDVLKFSAGIVTAVLIHEGSHALVAGLTDTHMNWETGSYNQPLGFTESASSNGKGIAVYSAGLLSPIIGSEIVLQSDKIDKNDAFVRGRMAWNILNPILYSLDYWVFRVTNKENQKKYQGDLEGVEHYANEPTAHGFALSMAAIATYQGYRFLQTQSWAPDWLKKNKSNLSMGPLPSGGFILSYKLAF